MATTVNTLTRTRSSYFRRYEKVIRVLVKYGFEDIVAHMPFTKWIAQANRVIPKRNGKNVLSFSRYERIRMVCEELGTTFIKLAQLASNRPDVLPQELLDQLEKFHDQAVEVPKEIIKATLEREYDRPLKDFFEYINYKPLASASIAQVHRARTIGGREVVLKVQRPNLDRLVKADIAIMKKLAGALERNATNLGAFQPMELVNMFEESILEELHFKEEAKNILRFQANFQDNEKIYVPDVFPEYSTDKVLCLEYIEGIKATDLATIDKFDLDPKELVLRGIGLYFEQVFDYGFFHADPHPGNIFVLKDGRICFIDFGMMGVISDEDKEILAVLMLAIAERDAKGLKKILVTEFTKGDDPPDEKGLMREIHSFFSSYTDISIGEIDAGDVVSGLNYMFYQYRLAVPSNLLLLLKAMVIIEGVGLTLDPQYNIIENIKPYAQKLLGVNYSPRKLFQLFLQTIKNSSRFVHELPEDLGDILKTIKQGKAHIEFEHKGLEPLYEKAEIISNRIAFSLVLAALILGSSVLAIAQIPPFYYGIPLPGIIGFSISFLLALKLLFSILKHGNF